MSLEDEMRNVLAQMSLIQYGKTQSFDSSGGKSESPDPRPSGEAWTLEDKWRDIWTHHPTHATLEAARDELRAWKVRQTPAETDGSSEDDWILKDGRGFTPDDVARRFNTTPTRVRNLRKRKELDMETGFKPSTEPVRDDSRERVLNLARQGCTIRQIEFQTGKARETVRRWLKEAA